MQNKVYDAVLFGATFYSVGYALAHKNCLIVDRGINLGAEFFGEYQFDGGDLSDYGKKLVGIAEKNGFNTVYQMQSVLSKLLSENDVDILLETIAMGAYTKPNSDVITLCDSDGQFEIHAKTVIDTTSLGSLNYLANKSLQKELFGDEDIVKKYLCASTESGFVHMEVPFEITYEKAAKALCNAVSDSDKIAFINNRFTYKFNKPIDFSGYNYKHIPSAQFENCVAAFEAGVTV